MVLRPRAFSPRLGRSVLHQGMLADIGRWRWDPAVGPHLRVDQPAERTREGDGIALGDRRAERLRPLPPKDCRILRDRLRRDHTIQTCHQRLLECGGHGYRAERPCQYVVPIDGGELS